MATENLDGIYGLPAAADYSAITKGRFVVVNTSGEYVLAGAGAVAHGVYHGNRPVAGAILRAINMRGTVVKMEVGVGGVTRGAKVSSDATGRAVLSVTSTHSYEGIALRAGAVGEVVEVLWISNLGLVP